MSGYTVLVLGAGASLPYGLPLGKGVLEAIRELLPHSDDQRMGEAAMTQWVGNQKTNNSLYPKFTTTCQLLNICGAMVL